MKEFIKLYFIDYVFDWWEKRKSKHNNCNVSFTTPPLEQWLKEREENNDKRSEV